MTAGDDSRRTTGAPLEESLLHQQLRWDRCLYEDPSAIVISSCVLANWWRGYLHGDKGHNKWTTCWTKTKGMITTSSTS